MIEEILKYKRTAINLQAKFNAASSISNVVDCGGMQLRRIVFPDSWTDANISFTIFDVDTKSTTIQTILQNFDGTDAGDLLIPGAPGKNIPLFGHWCDSISSLQIESDDVQTNATYVLLVFQPLYQGIHG